MWCVVDIMIFCFFLQLWAQELGVFPVRSVELTEQERLLIDAELFAAVEKQFAGRFDIMTPQRIQSGLKDVDTPEICAPGRCSLAFAQLLGLERLIEVTVSRRREVKDFRATLYHVEEASIVQTSSMMVRKGEKWNGLSNSLVQNLAKGNQPPTEQVQWGESSEMVSSVIEVEEEGVSAVLVPAGKYLFDASETIEITSFLMMKSEVTQDLYAKIMKKKPSHFVACGQDCPVERVSWYDAIQFANALSKEHERKECYVISSTGIEWKKDCDGWRLPTEKEWYYAAAGGLENPLPFGGSEGVDESSWYRGNAGGRVHRVCQKKENPFGLCDMSGNVWEWVWDQELSSDGNPTAQRILRGGSWGNRAEKNRTSVRLAYKPVLRNYAIGFRLVRNR